MSTNIAWTDETWNPVVGCTRVSDGCRNCYASTLHNRRYKANEKIGMAFCGVFEPKSSDRHIRNDENWPRNVKRVGRPPEGWAVRARKLGVRMPMPGQYDQPFAKVQLLPERLERPLHWRKPRMVFVNSMGDLFHKDVPEEFIVDVYAIMKLSPQHTFQNLTKRPERRRELLSRHDFPLKVWEAADRIACDQRRPLSEYHPSAVYLDAGPTIESFPPENVWEGVSIEDQETADDRVPKLLATPAAVRWVSLEPQLGTVNLSQFLAPSSTDVYHRAGRSDETNEAVANLIRAAGRSMGGEYLDWLVQGGESGANARPFAVEWARDVRDQCRAASVPYFCKQLGGAPHQRFAHKVPMASATIHPPDWIPLNLKSRAGSDESEWPEDLRGCRAWPKVPA